MKWQHPLMIAAGEFDQKDGAAGQDAWMKKVFVGNASLNPEFWSQDRMVYYYNVPGNSQIQVGGYYRRTLNFTSVTTPKSGHFMPADNYNASKAYIDDFFATNTLQCHNAAGGCRVNTKMCTAMNNCNGNGKCQTNGICLCDAGFFGADCSFKAFDLNKMQSARADTLGNDWFYVSYKGGNESNWQVTLKSLQEVNYAVYISFNLSMSPNQFDNDIMVKEVN